MRNSTLLVGALGLLSCATPLPQYEVPAHKPPALASLFTKQGSTPILFNKGHVEVTAFEPSCSHSPFGLLLGSIEDSSEMTTSKPLQVNLAAGQPIVLTFVHHSRMGATCPYSVLFEPTPDLEYEVTYEYDQTQCRALVMQRIRTPAAERDWELDPEQKAVGPCLDERTKKRLSQGRL
jgi:hypothetical protein